jgi:hypothetical protein
MIFHRNAPGPENQQMERKQGKKAVKSGPRLVNEQDSFERMGGISQSMHLGMQASRQEHKYSSLAIARKPPKRL